MLSSIFRGVVEGILRGCHTVYDSHVNSLGPTNGFKINTTQFKEENIFEGRSSTKYVGKFQGSFSKQFLLKKSYSHVSFAFFKQLLHFRKVFYFSRKIYTYSPRIFFPVKMLLVVFILHSLKSKHHNLCVPKKRKFATSIDESEGRSGCSGA